jgi:hypothetical protein
LLNGFHDSLEYSVGIPKDVVVPETQDAETAAPQVGVANLVSVIFSVLTSVRFDDEHFFKRDEVNHPRSKGHLPAEFSGCQLSRAEKPPELKFSVSQSATKT